MASITLTVPDALVPDILVTANAWLLDNVIDTTAMTSAQKVRRYIIGLVQESFVDKKYKDAIVTQGTALNTVVTQAKTDAAGIN